MLSESRFSAPPEVHDFVGLLWDCDGTIIDSTAAIVKYWHKMGKLLGVDPNTILETSHGRRSIDVIRIYNPSLATWDYVSSMEGSVPKEFGHDAVEIPGSRALLDGLEAAGAPWAIVTSGTRPLLTGWLDRLQLARPKHVVTAEDVVHGKPDPACYLLGAEKLQLAKGSAVLVLEDAPAGVRAGKAAGFKVVALATTHGVDQLKEAGADWIVADGQSMTLRGYDKESGRISIEIGNAWQG
ncbi:glycerol-3-phosphate phosphatase [Phyllosticta citribraziliensis]|uniref:Glycerol-3-phosphate phosphatase n=1 Tax=Phyllosticta citribraziliensis TaxID=989973 RepID=A0ABR1LLH6_9PEZI